MAKFELAFIAKLPGSLLPPRCQSNIHSFSSTSKFQKRCFWPIDRNSGCPISPKMLILRTYCEIQSFMSQKLHPWFPLTRSQSKVWHLFRNYPQKNQWFCSSQEKPSDLKSPKNRFSKPVHLYKLFLRNNCSFNFLHQGINLNIQTCGRLFSWQLISYIPCIENPVVRISQWGHIFFDLQILRSR